jgi:hypothetical protein
MSANLRDTSYATELSTSTFTSSGGDEARVERLWIKELEREEIRLSWWKDGRLLPRPLDLSVDR